MTEYRVDRGPGLVGSALAIAAAVGAVGLVAGTPAQLSALAVEVVGLLVIAAGVAIRRRDHRLLGAGIVLFGAAAVAAGIALGVLRPDGFTERFELLPGAVGVAILAWGLLPSTSAGSRRKVAFGAFWILAGVMASGVMYGADATGLLGATALAVVAWDAGEQAISLGEQVGRAADTTSVAVVHSGGTAAVGGAGVILGLGAYDLDVTGLPLGGLVLLLGAALALAVALYASG